MFIDLPNINNAASTEEKVAQLCSYVYKANEQLNAHLNNITVEKFWQESSQAVILGDSSDNRSVVNNMLQKYKVIRDLIIATADEYSKNEESLRRVYNGAYVAKSGFGTYLKDTTLTISENSTSVEQLFTYAAAANQYELYQENFIKEGLLDDSGSVPIYGIDIGLLQSFIADDDTPITISTPRKVRITPSSLEFWEGDSKVAYINSGAIYFPNANISGGKISGTQISGSSIEIDNGEHGGNRKVNFEVSNTGNVTLRGDIHFNSEVFARSLTIYNGLEYNQTYGNIAPWQSPNSPNNEGIALTMKNKSKFVSFNNGDNNPIFLFTDADGYETGIEYGLHTFGNGTRYKAQTRSVTVDGKTLSFVNGLLVAVT